MSNMIKAHSIRYDEVLKKTIDSHHRIDKEIEVHRSKVFQAVEKQNDFVEGLKAVVVEALPSNEEMKEQHVKVIEDAKNEAKHILNQAKMEAEQIKNEAYAEAQKKGYDDGIHQAKKEHLRQKSDLEEKARQLQEEYEAAIISIEPQMVEVIASLVEKITGIIVQDKDEVILYLIEKAIKNIDKAEEYTIKISKDDFEYVSMRKQLLLNAIGREVQLYISEDSSLRKNQCMIETELRVIDCSLDIQLNNLITDFKLISGI